MRFLSLALLLVANFAQAAPCDAGLQAFKNTVYAKVIRDCAGCHDGTRGNAPPFASADPATSYAQLINYANFVNVDHSLIVQRAGNNHCGISLCQAASGTEMSGLVSSWWSTGQSQCQYMGTYTTAQQALPSNLPGMNDGFTTMTFDLGSIKPELKGISFQIGVQDYLDASPQTHGAIRFRSPRFVGGGQSLYVKNIKVMLNGAFTASYNIYTTVDRTVSFFKINDAVKTATPIVSGESLLILKDGKSNPMITVSFEDIHVTTDQPSCANVSGYTSQVKPVLTTLQCMSCHQAGGGSIAEKTLDFTADDTRQCETVSALLDPHYFMLSAMMKFPSIGLIKHPALTDDQRLQYAKALQTWLSN